MDLSTVSSVCSTSIAVPQKKRRRSVLWTYFCNIGDKKAKCELCSKVICTAGNTSNMAKHLEMHHKKEHSEVKEFFEREKSRKQVQGEFSEKEKSRKLQVKEEPQVPAVASPASSGHQPTLKAFIKNNTSGYVKKSVRKASIDKALVDMMAIDLQPVSIVEGTGFQNLIKVLDPKYALPSRQTIMNEHLPTLYESKRSEIMESLANVKWCSITTDVWNDWTGKSYITVTCHMITPAWTMQSFVLQTALVPESHTIDDLASELKKITDNWGITAKVHCAITDGASNITGAVQRLHWNGLACFAHALNSVVTCAIQEEPQANEVIEKIQRIVSYFHESSSASLMLKEIQTGLDLANHKLIQQVGTEWNSTFHMMERYLEQNEGIRAVVCLENRSDLIISADQNAFIEEMISLLRPFENVATDISSETYVSASKIIPLVRGLQRITSHCVAPHCPNLRQNLLSQMDTRFDNLEEKPVIGIATLLDPRFKKLPFTNQSGIEALTNKIIGDGAVLLSSDSSESSFFTSSSTSNSCPPVTTAGNSVWDLFDQQVAESTSRSSSSVSTLAELNQYFKLPLIPRQDDPLQWWNQNSQVFPSLSKVAMVYLSTVATSVPSERLFSEAGQQVSARRNRLEPETVDVMLFLNKCL